MFSWAQPTLPLPAATRTVPCTAVPVPPTQPAFLLCLPSLPTVGQGLSCHLYHSANTCVPVPVSIWPLQGRSRGVPAAQGWQLPLGLTGLTPQVPTLPVGGGLPWPPRGLPAPCPTAQPGCASPQSWSTPPPPSETLSLQSGPHQVWRGDTTRPTSPS